MRYWIAALLAVSATGATAAPEAPTGPNTAARSASDAPASDASASDAAAGDVFAPANPGPTSISASKAAPLAERRDGALRATRERRWKEALAQWGALDEERPNDPQVTVEMGWALLETGQTNDARRRFQRALHLDPMNIRAREGLVSIALRSRNLDEAVRLATETARARPESADAYRTLGEAQKAAARRSEAEEAFRRAVTLDPSDARNHAGLASVLFIRNKSDEAIKEFRLAVRLDPANAEFQEGLGRAAMQGGRYAEAALAFANAMDIVRSPAPDWTRLDSLALLAIDALGRASSALHDGIEARQDVFEANTRFLNVTDALAQLPAIEKVDPTAEPAMAQRAVAYGLLGQAAASDLVALRKDSTSDAADAFVFREQARRAVLSARAGSNSGPKTNSGFEAATPANPSGQSKLTPPESVSGVTSGSTPIVTK